jgi:hypothetical protein
MPACPRPQHTLQPQRLLGPRRARNAHLACQALVDPRQPLCQDAEIVLDFVLLLLLQRDAARGVIMKNGGGGL